MQEDEEKEETIYDSGGREDAVADGEISPEEEAFMRGYEEAEEKPKEKKKDDEDDEEEKDTEEE